MKKGVANMERKDTVTLNGNPVTLSGEELKVGQKAPDFKALNTKLEEVSIDNNNRDTLCKTLIVKSYKRNIDMSDLR